MVAKAPIVTTKVTANPAFGAEFNVAWGRDGPVGTRDTDEFVGANVFEVATVVIVGDEVPKGGSTS
jgi:hypothetical protein